MWRILMLCVVCDACIIYVCSGVDYTLLDRIAARIRTQFVYTEQCMTGGTRDACLVFSHPNATRESDVGWGFRACTDTNYIRYTGDYATLFADVVDTLGRGSTSGRMSLCQWHDQSAGTNTPWCFYAEWDANPLCATLIRDTSDDADMLQVLSLVSASLCCLLATCVLAATLHCNATAANMAAALVLRKTECMPGTASPATGARPVRQYPQMRVLL